MKILLIEDNSDHAELIVDACEHAFTHTQISVCKTFNEGVLMLKKEAWSIALIDLQLPDSPLNQTIAALQSINVKAPIIVLTSLNDDTIGQQLVNNGVQDFLPKSELTPTLLHRICTYAIERKKQQIILEDRSANQQVFCRSLSHDFNGPVRNIGQLSELLKQMLSSRVELESQELEIFDKIQNKVEVMNQLTEGLTQYLQFETTYDEHEAIDLQILIEEVITYSQELKASRVKINVGSLPLVRGIKSQLFILFKNLLDNAITYNINPPEINITATTTDKTTVISIADNGIGISNKGIQKIFKPFGRLHTQKQYKGTGLGLSIISRIIDNHTGSIEVKSKEGEGSEFIITLPK